MQVSKAVSPMLHAEADYAVILRSSDTAEDGKAGAEATEF